MKKIAEMTLTDKTQKIQMNEKNVKKLGEFGKLLLDYRETRDIRKYITSMQENLIDGKLHIAIRTPGTVTGRNSAGEIAK